jgi:hypothetical protein
VALIKLCSTLASGKLSASKFLAGRGKGKGLQMLTAGRDAGLAHARYNDVVDEAGEWGDAADEEGGDGAPVGTEFGRVAVDAVEVVHVGDGHITASDDVVAAARDTRISGYGRGRWGLCGIVGDELSHENGCHRTQENGVAAEESKELCG